MSENENESSNENSNENAKKNENTGSAENEKLRKENEEIAKERDKYKGDYEKLIVDKDKTIEDLKPFKEKYEKLDKIQRKVIMDGLTDDQKEFVKKRNFDLEELNDYVKTLPKKESIDTDNSRRGGGSGEKKTGDIYQEFADDFYK
jgi:hypothetical protein